MLIFKNIKNILKSVEGDAIEGDVINNTNEINKNNQNYLHSTNLKLIDTILENLKNISKLILINDDTELINKQKKYHQNVSIDKYY